MNEDLGMALNEIITKMNQLTDKLDQVQRELEVQKSESSRFIASQIASVDLASLVAKDATPFVVSIKTFKELVKMKFYYPLQYVDGFLLDNEDVESFLREVYGVDSLFEVFSKHYDLYSSFLNKYLKSCYDNRIKYSCSCSYISYSGYDEEKRVSLYMIKILKY